MKKKLPLPTKKLAKLLGLSLLAAPCFADEVQLMSPDGFIDVEGEITSFDGTMIGILTSIGPVKIPASEVLCFGSGCLPGMRTESPERDLDFIVPGPELIEHLAKLANDFAEFKNISISSVTADQLELELAEGSVKARFFTAVQPAMSDDFVIVDVVSLNQGPDTAYLDVLSWSAAAQPSTQMLGVETFSVAIDPNLGVNDVSMQSLADIFSGRLTNWSDVGGPDQRILPVVSSGNLLDIDVVQNVVLSPFGFEMNSQVIRVDEGAIGRNSISQFPGLIALVNTRFADDLNIVAVQNSFGMPTESNAFSKGMHQLTFLISVDFGNLDVPPSITEFFDFVSTASPSGVNATSGLVDEGLGIQYDETDVTLLSRLESQELSGQEIEAGRLLTQTLASTERTSVVFRAGALSGIEAAWNRRALKQLSDGIESGSLNGRDILFVGFSDGDANAQSDLSQSRILAENVRRAFEAAAPIGIQNIEGTLETLGFGGLIPQNCGGNAQQDGASNRVEIWLRDAR